MYTSFPDASPFSPHPGTQTKLCGHVPGITWALHTFSGENYIPTNRFQTMFFPFKQTLFP